MAKATVITLGEEEKAMLLSWARRGKTERRLAERANVILAAAAGKPTKEIAHDLGTRPARVSKWRTRYARDGIEGLKDAPRQGAPVRYGQPAEKRILALLDQPPPSGFSTWSGPLIARELKDVSKHQVWRVMRRHGLSLTRRRSWCGFLKWEELSQTQRARILSQLQECPEIGNYHIMGFLSVLSKENPDEVVKVLERRVEIAESRESNDGYKPLPYNWYEQKLGVRDSRDFILIARGVLKWVAGRPASWYRRQAFRSIVGYYDESVIQVLSESLLSESREPFDAVVSVLREAPRTFALENVEFVQYALDAAQQYGPDQLKSMRGALWESVATGSKSGSAGEPFIEDIEQRDKSAEIARMLPNGSTEQEFYLSLHESAQESIRWHAERDEISADGRGW